jgi:hypothetical protein
VTLYEYQMAGLKIGAAIGLLLGLQFFAGALFGRYVAHRARLGERRVIVRDGRDSWTYHPGRWRRSDDGRWYFDEAEEDE